MFLDTVFRVGCGCIGRGGRILHVYDIIVYEGALMFLTVETLPLFSGSRMCS